MNTALTLSWRNLWRHKRRTWLTIGAMLFSNVLLVFLITLQFGTYDMMIDNSLSAWSSHLQVARKGYHDEPKMRSVVPDMDAMVKRIRDQIPESKVAPRAEAFVLASSEERSFGLQLAGVDALSEAEVSSIPGLIKEGKPLSNEAPNQIIIGRVLARNLKVGIGDEVTVLGSGIDASFAAAIVVVRGIFESGIRELDRSLALIPLSDFRPIFSMQSQGHRIQINAPDINDTESLQRRITTILADQQYEVLNWNQLNPGLRQAIKSDLVSAWFMYCVLVILVAFSVLNTQLMSVLERTREFGIMSAVGLRSNVLVKLIFLETSFMAGLGLVIGVLAGTCVAGYFSVVGFGYPGMEEMAARYNISAKMYPALTPFSILLGPVVVFIGCVLAAIYPAFKLRALEPVEAMRAA